MRKPPNDAAGLGREAEPGIDDGLLLSQENKGPERTCILTREHGARDRLVRLALGPDGQVLPDVRAKAPGRGAWIGVDRPALDAAQAKGKLKGALSRAFKTGELQIPADLGERIETALRQAALDRLGLEARASTLLTGSEKIEVAARRGDVHLLLHAADAGLDGNGKLDQAWRVGGGEPQGLVLPATRTILSMALGRENVVHVALIDRAAAARVRHAIDRWRAFIGPDARLSAAAAASPVVSAVD
ncbi:DUF448 domain-containing protein [Allosphingosinicella sp.]|uniref:DUF448 domain-containing protein n=1 Tax=Allosphingosinicella sp. TaxID=2823234 RepID=UPI003D762A79